MGGLVASGRVNVLLKVLKPAVRLSRWRKDILSVNEEMVSDMIATTQPVLDELRDAITETYLLRETWGYNSTLPDPDPPDKEWFRTWGHIFRTNNFTIGTGCYYSGRT